MTRRRRTRTTERGEDTRPAPDLVDRAFAADAPNQLWSWDISVLQQCGREVHG